MLKEVSDIISSSGNALQHPLKDVEHLTDILMVQARGENA